MEIIFEHFSRAVDLDEASSSSDEDMPVPPSMNVRKKTTSAPAAHCAAERAARNPRRSSTKVLSLLDFIVGVYALYSK